MLADSPSNPQSIRDARGAALKAARNQAGLSARKLAERTNMRSRGSDITEHAIYAYENGRVLLSSEVAVRIADALSLHPGELLIGDPDYANAPEAGPETAPAESNVPHEVRQALTIAGRNAYLSAVTLLRVMQNYGSGAKNASNCLALLDLLERDCRACYESVHAPTIDRLQRDRSVDALADLIQACKEMQDDVTGHFNDLLDGEVRTAVFRNAADHIIKSLSRHANELRNALGLNERGMHDPAGHIQLVKTD